ncbi:hypothetical protein Prum_084020 [Phytohabitans rumicis]|uniref:Uncharacterized protein n=1 Tax=Phytohabitans rumicis TaxID=1076125 RepID=A0A6V8LGJ5_9ACTN|nr:hypothetical protein Prum_084020 [Phytohabitans rumicis]
MWGADRQGVVRRYVDDVSALAPYIDPAGYHTHNGSPLLTVYGVTPDGRRLLVQTIQYDDDPSRVIVLLARGDAPFQPVASGFANWKAALPVRLELPDGQGILVAAEGKRITYRLNGTRHDAAPNAALLPPGATNITAG